jgi:hypothetical protein
VTVAGVALAPDELTVPSTPTENASLPVYVPAGKVIVQNVPGTRIDHEPPATDGISAL